MQKRIRRMINTSKTIALIIPGETGRDRKRQLETERGRERDRRREEREGGEREGEKEIERERCQ